jgi:cell division septal protein FtsQ
MRKQQKTIKSRGSIPAPKRRTHRRAPRNWGRINSTLRGIAFVGLAVELGLILFANPSLRVTKVRVDGAQTLTPAQVYAEAHVPPRANIFRLALREPFAHRLERDPLIDHASRRIQLPDTLILTVTERQPFATLASGGQYWLLDQKGVPYQSLDKPYPGVPLVAVQSSAVSGGDVMLGQPLHTRWLAQTYSLMGLLARNSTLEASKISVDQNANICLNRADKLQILLGQPEALPQKVALAEAAVEANGGTIARRAAYIDVSCPELPVWKPRPETEEDRAQARSWHRRQAVSEDAQSL